MPEEIAQINSIAHIAKGFNQTFTPPTITLPTDYSWTNVMAGVNALLSNALVESAVIVILGLRFAPRIIQTILQMVRGR